jgi:hypothetical protein
MLKIWGSNLGRSNRIIYSKKHLDQLLHPPRLPFNEIQSFFSGSKVASADSLTTHMCLEPSLQISGAIPPLNLSPSMAHSGTTLFYPHHLPLYISLKKSHHFSGNKVASADSLTTHMCLEPSLQINGAIPPLNLSPSMAHSGTILFYPRHLPLYISLSRGHIISGLIKEHFIHHFPHTCTLHDPIISSSLIQLHYHYDDLQ